MAETGVILAPECLQRLDLGSLANIHFAKLIHLLSYKTLTNNRNKYQKKRMKGKGGRTYYVYEKVRHRGGAGDYLNIHSNELRRFVGKDYKSVVTSAVDNGYLVVNPVYSAGNFPKSYALSSELLSSIKSKPLVSLELPKSKLRGFVRALHPVTKIEKFLYSRWKDFKFPNDLDINNLVKVYQRQNKPLFAINTLMISYSWFSNEWRWATTDKYGRYHTNLTNMPKLLRARLIHPLYNDDAQGLVEIDIKNSQPYFFSQLIRNEYNQRFKDIKVIEDDERLKANSLLLEFNNYFKEFKPNEGLFYESYGGVLPEATRLDRKQIKEDFFGFLYNVQDKTEQHTFFKYLNETYPEIALFIRQLKKDNYKDIALALQKLESKCIVNGFAQHLKHYEKQQQVSIPYFTIHDCVVCPAKYLDEVYQMMIHGIVDNCDDIPNISAESLNDIYAAESQV